MEKYTEHTAQTNWRADSIASICMLQLDIRKLVLMSTALHCSANLQKMVDKDNMPNIGCWFANANLQNICRKPQFAKQLYRRTVCKKWSIETICKNIVPNNNFHTICLEQQFTKFTKNIQNNNLQKVVRESNSINLSKCSTTKISKSCLKQQFAAFWKKLIDNDTV